MNLFLEIFLYCGLVLAALGTLFIAAFTIFLTVSFVKEVVLKR